MQARVESLTIFRFLAAVIVYLFHFGKGSYLANLCPQVLRAGPEVVTFFFVLSGFVLTLNYSGHLDDRQRIISFYIKRLARLYPLYIIALILMVSVKDWSTYNFTRQLILSLTMIQSWFPNDVMALNVPAWAVSCEIFFYLVFPFISILLAQHQNKIGLLSVTLLIFWFSMLLFISNIEFFMSSMSDQYIHNFVYYFPPFHLSSFLFGCIGSLALQNKDLLFKFKGIFSNLMPISGILLIFLSLRYKNFLNGYFDLNIPIAVGFLAPIFLIFILTLATSDNHITKLLSHKMLVALGNASFAFYILQYPLSQIIPKFLYKQLNLNYNQCLLIFGIILTVISLAAYRYIEKPFYSLFNSWVFRWKPNQLQIISKD